MRELLVTQNVTVDGVVETTDDWFPVAGSDPDLDAVLAAQRDASDAILLGRGTFESMRDYWSPKTEDTTGSTDHLNRVQKYVVSSTPIDPQWANTTILARPQGSVAEESKTAPYTAIVCTESIAVCRQVLSEGLVHEIRLFVYPYARGHVGAFSIGHLRCGSSSS